MNLQYPSYLSNNTQLVLYLLRGHLPLEEPVRMANIIKLIEKLTNRVGVYGQHITNSMIGCAIRNNIGKETSEYEFMGRGIYKRIIPQKGCPLVTEEVMTTNSAQTLLENAHKAVSRSLKLDPLDQRYTWEQLETARQSVREILDHIKTASELLEKFPYKEMVVKTDA